MITTYGDFERKPSLLAEKVKRENNVSLMAELRVKKEKEKERRIALKLKQCSQCRRWLQRGAFYLMTQSPDRLSYYCKECLKENRGMRKHG